MLDVLTPAGWAQLCASVEREPPAAVFLDIGGERAPDAVLQVTLRRPPASVAALIRRPDYPLESSDTSKKHTQNTLENALRLCSDTLHTI